MPSMPEKRLKIALINSNIEYTVYCSIIKLPQGFLNYQYQKNYSRVIMKYFLMFIFITLIIHTFKTVLHVQNQHRSMESQNVWNQYKGKETPSSVEIHDIFFQKVKKNAEVVDFGADRFAAGERAIPADSVVLGTYDRPSQVLYYELKGHVPHLFRAGDCVAPRRSDTPSPRDGTRANNCRGPHPVRTLSGGEVIRVIIAPT